MCDPLNLVLEKAHANITIASADRRPVDPPPVVELKVFEGEQDPKTDITFQHNANFFLFTTLENARPMAKGRVPATPSTFPVLTGSPVAGMAYLDRPSPAGYFIFPDLSVRHEGMYRLSFSLFEELKESKDADVDPPEGSPNTRDKLLSSNPMAPRAHVHFRLEVKSAPFAVFSAKKFPGLSESTLLSRTVAEQGCRVRIRRDVRMRRRDKPADGYQGDYDDEHYGHSERFGTPQHPPDRPRSISNGSIDAHTPFSTGRRPSMQDYFGQSGSYTPVNYQPPPPPAPVQSANSYGPHLSFGGSVSTPTFPPPQMPQQPVQSYVQNTSNYQFTPNTHTRQMSAPQTYGYPQPQHQVPNYSSHAGFAQSQTYADNPEYRPVVDHRRTSATLLNNQTQQAAIPPSMNNYVQNHPAIQQLQQEQSYYVPPQPQSGSSSATPNSANTNANPQGPPQLPPLRTDNLASKVAIEPKYELKSPSNGISRPIVPSPSYTSSYYDHYMPAVQSANSLPSSVSNNTLSNPISNSVSSRTTKREFAAVFDDSHMKQPVHNGMRPISPDHGRDRPMIQTDDGDVEDAYDVTAIDRRTLVYKRADGRHQAKKCPTPTEAYM